MPCIDHTSISQVNLTFTGVEATGSSCSGATTSLDNSFNSIFNLTLTSGTLSFDRVVFTKDSLAVSSVVGCTVLNPFPDHSGNVIIEIQIIDTGTSGVFDLIIYAKVENQFEIFTASAVGIDTNISSTGTLSNDAQSPICFGCDINWAWNGTVNYEIICGVSSPSGTVGTTSNTTSSNTTSSVSSLSSFSEDVCVCIDVPNVIEHNCCDDYRELQELTKDNDNLVIKVRLKREGYGWFIERPLFDYVPHGSPPGTTPVMQEVGVHGLKPGLYSIPPFDTGDLVINFEPYDDDYLNRPPLISPYEAPRLPTPYDPHIPCGGPPPPCSYIGPQQSIGAISVNFYGDIKWETLPGIVRGICPFKKIGNNLFLPPIAIKYNINITAITTHVNLSHVGGSSDTTVTETHVGSYESWDGSWGFIPGSGVVTVTTTAPGVPPPNNHIVTQQGGGGAVYMEERGYFFTPYALFTSNYARTLLVGSYSPTGVTGINTVSGNTTITGSFTHDNLADWNPASHPEINKKKSSESIPLYVNANTGSSLGGLFGFNNNFPYAYFDPYYDNVDFLPLRIPGKHGAVLTGVGTISGVVINDQTVNFIISAEKNSSPFNKITDMAGLLSRQASGDYGRSSVTWPNYYEYCYMFGMFASVASFEFSIASVSGGDNGFFCNKSESGLYTIADTCRNKNVSYISYMHNCKTCKDCGDTKIVQQIECFDRIIFRDRKRFIAGKYDLSYFVYLMSIGKTPVLKSYSWSELYGSSDCSGDYVKKIEGLDFFIGEDLHTEMNSKVNLVNPRLYNNGVAFEGDVNNIESNGVGFKVNDCVKLDTQLVGAYACLEERAWKIPISDIWFDCNSNTWKIRFGNSGCDKYWYNNRESNLVNKYGRGWYDVNKKPIPSTNKTFENSKDMFSTDDISAEHDLKSKSFSNGGFDAIISYCSEYSGTEFPGVKSIKKYLRISLQIEDLCEKTILPENCNSSSSSSSSSSSTSSVTSGGAYLCSNVSVAENVLRQYAIVTSTDFQYNSICCQIIKTDNKLYENNSDSISYKYFINRIWYFLTSKIPCRDLEYFSKQSQKNKNDTTFDSYGNSLIDCSRNCYPIYRYDQLVTSELSDIAKYSYGKLIFPDTARDIECSEIDIEMKYDSVKKMYIWDTKKDKNNIGFYRKLVLNESNYDYNLYTLGTCCRYNSIYNIRKGQKNIDIGYSEFVRLGISSIEKEDSYGNLIERDNGDEKFTISAMGVTGDDFFKNKINSCHSSVISGSNNINYVFYDDANTGHINCAISYDKCETWTNHFNILGLNSNETATMPDVFINHITDTAYVTFIYNHNLLCVYSINLKMFNSIDAYKKEKYSDYGKSIREGSSFYVLDGNTTSISLSDRFVLGIDPTSGKEYNIYDNVGVFDSISYSGYYDKQGILRIWVYKDGKFKVFSSGDGKFWTLSLDNIEYFRFEGFLQPRDVAAADQGGFRDDLFLDKQSMSVVYDFFTDSVYTLFIADGKLALRTLQNDIIDKYSNEKDENLKKDIKNKYLELTNDSINKPKYLAGFSNNPYPFYDYYYKFIFQKILYGNSQPDGFVDKYGNLIVYFYWTYPSSSANGERYLSDLILDEKPY